MRIRSTCLAICLASSADLACEQLTDEQRAGNAVLLVSAYMEQCAQGDDLLRSTCSRIQRHLSPGNRRYCELPALSFTTRTERQYRDFQESFRAEIANDKDKIQRLTQKTREAFDDQFAQLRAGKVSMPDLESLHKFLGDNCLTLERDWLSLRNGAGR
jgi:hypothetical protein